MDGSFRCDAAAMSIGAAVRAAANRGALPQAVTEACITPLIPVVRENFDVPSYLAMFPLFIATPFTSDSFSDIAPCSAPSISFLRRHHRPILWPTLTL